MRAPRPRRPAVAPRWALLVRLAAGMGAGAPRRGAPTGPSVEMQGTVKWYNATKGFGFVAPLEGGKDVFVHASALQRANVMQLAEGQTIWMDVVQGAKGPEAASIRVD
jgi:CspA family cold shock protein